MPGTFEYCVVTNGTVENIIILDETKASAYAAALGKTVVPSVKGVIIGDRYHDDKFWKVVHNICEGGMTHDGQTEPCPGGEALDSVHEEEITQ